MRIKRDREAIKCFAARNQESLYIRSNEFDQLVLQPLERAITLKKEKKNKSLHLPITTLGNRPATQPYHYYPSLSVTHNRIGCARKARESKRAHYYIHEALRAYEMRSPKLEARNPPAADYKF